MEKLLLVDGSNLLFQMFYGMPARILNGDGKPIQGTLGFVGALLKIIRKVQPTRVAVFFDGECHNDRTDLDENYKANREDYSQMPEEDTPFFQMPDVYRALDYLGICHQETTVCETDDWIAAYCRRYAEQMEIVIASQDSDFFQLIGENVSVLRYRGENSLLCNVPYIQEKLGISPAQYADFKSMTGDNADNIKGADKIGPKTAAWLLQQFENLETILTRAEEITKPSVRTSIMENEERLRTNYKLIYLTGDAEIPFLPEELDYQYNGVTTTQVLAAIGLR
jgi:DNA polymerase-1